YIIYVDRLVTVFDSTTAFLRPGNCPPSALRDKKPGSAKEQVKVSPSDGPKLRMTLGNLYEVFRIDSLIGENRIAYIQAIQNVFQFKVVASEQQQGSTKMSDDDSLLRLPTSLDAYTHLIEVTICPFV